MLSFNIITVGIGLGLIWMGIDNHVEGPIWLGFLILAITLISQIFFVVDNYIKGKLRDW